MSSLARLSAALGTVAVLATVGLGSAYADWESYDPATDVTTITTDPQVINHWQTVQTTYSCPQGHQLVPQGTDLLGNIFYFTRNESDGILDVYSSLGNWNILGPQSVAISWTNWAVTGDQTFQAIYKCTGNLFPGAPTYPAPTTQAATQQSNATQPTPSPTAQQTGPTGLTNLADFQAAFDKGLPTLGDGIHTDPSSGLLPGIQTPPNVAALGRHLVRVYATPGLVDNGKDLTMSAACPGGGLVTADPGLRSALPYVPRVTNVNVSSSLASGDIGQSSLTVQFTNRSGHNELAAFQLVCSVRGN